MNSAGAAASTTAAKSNIEKLDELEQEVIGILQLSGQVLQEMAKERFSQKQVDQFCQQVTTKIRSVDSGLSEQIRHLTQVSTGHPHEGSSYPSQKVLQTAWHRIEHARSRVADLERLRQRHLQQQEQRQLQQEQQPMQE